MALLQKILAHIKLHREWYWFLPASSLVLLAVVRFILFLTGHAPADSAESLFGAAQNYFVVTLALLLTGSCMGHIIPDIDEKLSWQHYLIQVASVLVFFCICSALLFSLLR